jgi:PAS domain S-box-containing protein
MLDQSAESHRVRDPDDRLRLLSGTARAFAGATADPQFLLDTVARRVAESLDGHCAVLLASEHSTQLLCSAGFDPDPDVLREASEALCEPLDLDLYPAARSVFDTGEPFLACTLDRVQLRPPQTSQRYFDFIERAGVHSLLIVALGARGRSFGLLVLAKHRPHSPGYNQDDLDLASILADHAALAITCSRLHAAELATRTAAEHTQSLLRETQLSHRQFIESSPLAMFVFDAQTHEMLEANDAALVLYGYSREEFLRLHVTDLRHPEDAAELAIKLATIGRSSAIGPARHRRSDGTTIHIEGWASASPFLGRTARFVAVIDVTERLGAEHRQRAAELRFTRLTESGLLGIAIVDRENRVTEINDAALEIVGYSREEALDNGFRWQMLTPPEWMGEYHDRARSLANTSVVAPKEKEYWRKDRTRVAVLSGAARLSDDEILVVILDLTGRKWSAAAIEHLHEARAAEAKFRSLLEAAPDAIVIVDREERILLVNAQTERQFGYHRDGLLGQQVKNIIPQGFAERLIADGTRTAAEALAQQIGAGIELSGRRKDGSEFPIEIMLSPLDSPEGIMVTAAIRDITVRRTAERHLAQVEARYRGLLEAAPDAMVLVNQGGEIVLVNLDAEKQFGYGRDELVGQQVKTIIPEGFAEAEIAEAVRSEANALTNRVRTATELVGRSKNGSVFPIEVMLSPLDNAEGVLLTMAIRDITNRKKAQAHLLQTVAELNRSNEELEQFAYVASHDLQEPLRMVASYTQLLAKRYKGKLDDDADEFIAFAVDGANRMQQLIQDLLLYSRVGASGMNRRSISSEGALSQAIANLRGAIEQSGALVTHGPLPTVWADEQQLIQLFQNLVGNGIKYQKAGAPTVHVSSSRSGGATWRFSVRDNGMGIESKYFERIFGMFQRLHKPTEFAGTGIGLAICKKIVERHDGKISVDSQLGQGSTFHFALAGSER